MEKQVWEEVDIELLKDIRQLYKVLTKRMKQKWNRDLPLEELLFDRWERAEQLGFDEGTSIYHNSYIYGDVKVGRYTWIGPFTLLDGTGGLEIGYYCNISSGVQIYTHDTVKWALSSGKVEYERAPVKIGNCCYIGPLSIITKGIKVGDHSLIGAHSLVNKDIPPNSIAFGVPAKVVGKVEISKEGDVKLTYFEQKG
ncbi:MAG: acyltransferase [Thermoplasmatales archaeon]|nr:acyltransferase [Thermoplasmatales archaeon]